MERTKVKCNYCGREISKSNIAKHEKACCEKRKIEKISYKLDHDGLDCQYCGKTCKNRNSLCNHERLCMSNPNRQIFQNNTTSNLTEFNSKRKAGIVSSWNKGLTKETDERVAKNAEAIQIYYENNPGAFKGKHHTKESRELISKRRKDFLEANPNMVPYLLNHASKESYPETYFKELFANNSINLVYHHRVHIYELDFCDVDRKIDIEIDGEQHYLDKRIVESNKRRTEYLENLGWKIYRVRWADYCAMNYEEKSKIVADIKALLM